MTMPIQWVEKIFLKLNVVYGRDFLGRYEGIPLDHVKADWALELAGYENMPHAIAYALQNLPDSKPPTVYEFRTIARRAPAKQLPRLDAPAADPERARAAIAEARALLAMPKMPIRAAARPATAAQPAEAQP